LSGATVGLIIYTNKEAEKPLLLVVNTWRFTNATDRAYEAMAINGSSALDAVEQGCNVCEDNPEQCGFSVGYGGRPNEDGETTLDAMIMWMYDAGAVGCLKSVKRAISVARKVLEETNHTLLVGDDATRFAEFMGFPLENLSTNGSLSLWEEWKANNHTPNFWTNGRNYSIPYPPPYLSPEFLRAMDPMYNHDTIGMVAMDADDNLCAGATTNGLNFKIPGRVGDTPIPGAGAYADNDVGAAAATGKGDIMIRFLPSFRAVMNMASGMNPTRACEDALSDIEKHFPTIPAAVIAINKDRDWGAAKTKAYGSFPYAVRNSAMTATQIEVIE